MKTSYWKLQKNSDNKEIMQEAAALIRAGEVVSFPTETVYGLGADGLNPEAVAKIFAAKGRPNDNPLILHIAKKEDIAQLTTGLNANAKKLMEHFWPGPLTLIVNKSAIVPDAVSAGLETVAVRFPSNKFAQDFIRACGCPIAAPSANISVVRARRMLRTCWRICREKLPVCLMAATAASGWNPPWWIQRVLSPLSCDRAALPMKC